LFIDGEISLTEVDPSWTDGPSPYVLAASAWDALTQAVDVHQAARGIVSELNRRFHEDSPLHPEIKVGRYVWQPDATAAGGFRRHAVLLAEGATVRFSGARRRFS
jgi:hypothetical protein